QLVLESPQRSIGEIQNLVTTRIRPTFVTIGGISATAPFGGNNRTMGINVDTKEMRAYRLSADELLPAIGKNNIPSPAGNFQIGDFHYMTPSNTLLKDNEDFMNTPIKSGSGPTVYIRDIATVNDESDKTTGYAMVNGKKTVYLPVIKKASASTLSAINNLKNSMPLLKENLPEDVNVEFVFDQSNYIENALTNLMFEGILGAILTGLMVLLFLGDRR